MEELVVLVDQNNNQIGTAPKDQVHTQNTPLHRGFSLFLFNSKNELLLTRRALTKKTFPGVWTNTVCGHPGPGESVVDAAKRRLRDELGIELPSARSDLLKRGSTSIRSIRVVASYRYRFADAHGIVENEICPIVVAYSDAQPRPNRKEVEEHRWIRWGDFLEEIRENPQNFSPWSREEAAFIAPLI